MNFLRFTVFLRSCGNIYRNFRTILKSKWNEVPENWSTLLNGMKTKGMHPAYVHLSFDANAEMTGRERRITVSAHSP